MNNKHKKTLALIYKHPIPSNIRWSDIESLFRALGGRLTEGTGSMVEVTLHDEWKVFHRPHPQKEASKKTIKYVRIFLEITGVRNGYEL